MQLLDRGIGGIVLVVDQQTRLRGVLTDGDIRRALLRGHQMHDQVEHVMNVNFQSGSTHDSRENNLKKLTNNVRHLPVLDDEGRPVSILSWLDIWKMPLAEPSLGGNEMKYISDCISTLWISSQGGYITRFQDIFSGYIGGGYAHCTSSGTAALELALRALDVGPGHEVIVPNTTFGATANVVIHVGAKPVFVDIEPDTKTLSVEGFRAAITGRTRAVIPVHLYGHPCDMDPIMEISRKHNIYVIEDCAESLGAEYKGRKAGLIGDIGCFSFFANKVITTGEGGMTLTRNQSVHERMGILRDHGMSKERRYWHLEPGFNYRMTNLQAAVGLAQMERINHFLEARREIVEKYNSLLKSIDGITLPYEAAWAKNIYWLYSIEVDSAVTGIDRDALARKMHEYGIETRPVFPPLNIQPAFGNGRPGTYPVSEKFAATGLSLPTYNGMDISNVNKICAAISDITEKAKRLAADKQQFA